MLRTPALSRITPRIIPGFWRVILQALSIHFWRQNQQISRDARGKGCEPSRLGESLEAQVSRDGEHPQRKYLSRSYTR